MMRAYGNRRINRPLPVRTVVLESTLRQFLAVDLHLVVAAVQSLCRLLPANVRADCLDTICRAGLSSFVALASPCGICDRNGAPNDDVVGRVWRSASASPAGAT